MTDTVVTLVTKDAAQDNLSTQDYRDIFTELREKLSLSGLVGALGSEYSKAVWSRYERGDYELTRQMRNDLRRGVGLPELPALVGDAVTDRTHPDAAVWAVGEGAANHVILVANDDNLTLHVNGGVTAWAGMKSYPSNGGVGSTEIRYGYVDSQNDAQGQIGAFSTVLRKRRSLVRPVASQRQVERRAALDVAWRDVIDAGLAALESR